MATKVTVWGLQLLALSSVVVLSQLPSVYTAPGKPNTFYYRDVGLKRSVSYYVYIYIYIECSLSASYVHGGNVGALAECSYLRGNLVLSQLSLQG